MARRGRFGRSGGSQNLTMLVYQLMKQQMQDELEAILKAYETNMAAGIYEAQFNGQNVDGEFVLSYYRQMLAGFPPGSTEYETINSRLQAFEERYRTDVQNLIINAMNNGTRIDFGLLGSGFQNKGISEVELSDVQSWADQEIADLIANGQQEQADKISGVVFVAKFNVENDGKSAAYSRGDISASEYAKWLSGEMQGALDAGLTTSSEAYRQIMKLQASMSKTATENGQVEAYNNYVNRINSLQNRLDGAATKLFDKYKQLGGIHAASIDALIAANNGDAYAAFQYLAKVRGSQEDPVYGAIYGAIFDQLGTDPEEMGFADAVFEVNSILNSMQDQGFKGVKPEDREKLEDALQGVIAGNNSFVVQSGISFSGTAGQTAISTLFKDLKGAGAYSVQEGIQQDLVSGHPDLVRDAFKRFGQLASSIDTTGYEYLMAFAQGKFSAELIGPEQKSWFTQSELSDGYITDQEFERAVGSRPFNEGELTRWIDGIVVHATKGLPFPGAVGAGDTTANSIVKAYLDSRVHDIVVKNGGTMVVSPSGVMSVSTTSTDPGGQNMSRAVMLPAGSDGKVRFARAVPLEIHFDVDGDNPKPYNFPISIQVFNTGGNARGDNTFMVLSNGKGTSHQIPWYQGRKWLESMGYTIDDNQFHTPGENGAMILISRETPIRDTQEWTERFKNFDNPASQYFWGKTSAGNGLGIIDVNENTVSTTYNYGIVGNKNYLDSVIRGIISTGRESILAKATEMAAAEGREVTRDYINRAAFETIPFYSRADNTDILEMELLMRHPTISNTFNSWYSNIKPGRIPMVTDAAGRPVMGTNPYSGGPNAGNELMNDIKSFWDNLGKPQLPGPQGKAPTNPLDVIGSALSGVGGFLGEVFKNRPTMVSKPPQLNVKATTPQAVPPVKISSYTTGYTEPPKSTIKTTAIKPPTTGVTQNTVKTNTGVGVNSGTGVYPKAT